MKRVSDLAFWLVGWLLPCGAGGHRHDWVVVESKSTAQVEYEAVCDYHESRICLEHYGGPSVADRVCIECGKLELKLSACRAKAVEKEKERERRKAKAADRLKLAIKIKKQEASWSGEEAKEAWQSL